MVNVARDASQKYSDFPKKFSALIIVISQFFYTSVVYNIVVIFT